MWGSEVCLSLGSLLLLCVNPSCRSCFVIELASSILLVLSSFLVHPHPLRLVFSIYLSLRLAPSCSSLLTSSLLIKGHFQFLSIYSSLSSLFHPSFVTIPHSSLSSTLSRLLLISSFFTTSSCTLLPFFPSISSPLIWVVCVASVLELVSFSVSDLSSSHTILLLFTPLIICSSYSSFFVTSFMVLIYFKAHSSILAHQSSLFHPPILLPLRVMFISLMHSLNSNGTHTHLFFLSSFPSLLPFPIAIWTIIITLTTVADFFIGLISMPLYTLYLLPFPRWPLGPFVCDLWLAFDYLNSNASVLNLLVISFDRYFSVTRPLTYRVRRTTRRACLMISMTWFISLILWPPWIFAWPYIEGKRSVPINDCYIQFLETNPYITFGTAIAAFYIPVTVMCILYWRIWRETEKRYKDLTTLFLVSAVGGRVRTAPGHHGGVVTVEEDETFADRFKSFLTWPVSIFGSKKSDSTMEGGIETDTLAGGPAQRGGGGGGEAEKGGGGGGGKARTRRDDPTSTTEDEDDTSDATCGTSSNTGTGKKSTLASDSIYTILITLGDGPVKSSSGSKNQTLLTPTTTASSTTLTPVNEMGYSVDGQNNCTETHTIKQFFESAISIAAHDEIGEDNQTSSSRSSHPTVTATHSSGGGSSKEAAISPSSSSKARRPTTVQKEDQKVRKISGPETRVQRVESPGSGLRMHSGRSASNSGPSSTKAHMSSVSQPKSEKKAAKTLSAILLTFIITWTPYNVLVLIKTLSPSDSEVISDSLWYFSYYLCYINSTINPLCYALCNVNFRNTYLRILKCQWTLNPTRQRVKDAQFDLPPAQSRKEKKKRNKKRNKILASRQQQQSIQQSHRNAVESSLTAPVKSPGHHQQQQQSPSPSSSIPSGSQQRQQSPAYSTSTGVGVSSRPGVRSSDSKLFVTATNTSRGRTVTTTSSIPVSTLSSSQQTKIQHQMQQESVSKNNRKTKKNPVTWRTSWRSSEEPRRI